MMIELEITEFVAELHEEKQDDLPGYSTPGWVLAEILTVGLAADGGTYDYELGEVQYDGCAYWIQEEEGFDYWLDAHFRGDIAEPGWYVIENIVGTYHRGDGWTTDDDVDWNCADPRKATDEEIETLHVEK